MLEYKLYHKVAGCVCVCVSICVLGGHFIWIRTAQKGHFVNAGQRRCPAYWRQNRVRVYVCVDMFTQNCCSAGLGYHQWLFEWLLPFFSNQTICPFWHRKTIFLNATHWIVPLVFGTVLCKAYEWLCPVDQQCVTLRHAARLAPTTMLFIHMFTHSNHFKSPFSSSFWCIFGTWASREVFFFFFDKNWNFFDCASTFTIEWAPPPLSCLLSLPL